MMKLFLSESSVVSGCGSVLLDCDGLFSKYVAQQ